MSADIYCQILNNRYKCNNGVLKWNGKKGQQARCHRNRESTRGGVCIESKRGWRPLKSGRLESLVCELLFTTLFIQITRRGSGKEEEERS